MSGRSGAANEIVIFSVGSYPAVSNPSAENFILAKHLPLWRVVAQDCGLAARGAMPPWPCATGYRNWTPHQARIDGKGLASSEGSSPASSIRSTKTRPYGQ